MVNIVQNIAYVAKTLFRFKNKLSEANRKERIEIADYLKDVSGVLQAVHDSLQQDIVPHGKCKELEHHAENMPNVISDKMVTNVQELANKLLAAHTVEHDLWIELNDAQDKAQELQKIEEAAGLLRGMATSIRAGGKPH